MIVKFLVCCTLILGISSYAQTSIPAGHVNGKWTVAGSPYKIYGNIDIPNDDSLVIEPGVTVSFQGMYHFMVFGKITAIGTVKDSIIFTSLNAIKGWRGIRFDNTKNTNDTSRFYCCKIQFGRATSDTSMKDQNGGGLFINNFSKVVFSHSRVVNCSSVGSGAGIYIYGASPIITYSSITYNSLLDFGQGGAGIFIKNGNPSITYSYIANNNANASGNNRGGGIYMDSCYALLANNIISKNLNATIGGGIYTMNGSPTILKNSIKPLA